MNKTTISRAEYLQLVGLLALAKRYNDILKDIETTFGEIVGVEDTSGHVMDITYGSRPLDEGLKLLGVTVE